MFSEISSTVPLAQSVEHQTFNLRAAGSSPAWDSIMRNRVFKRTLFHFRKVLECFRMF